MALGGGTFSAQNKILNGAYLNFVSANKASSALSDRGVVSMPLELDWGEDGKVFEVTPEDFQKDALKLFGYPYTHEKMKGLRDLFAYGIRKLYAYKLTGGGDKAACTHAAAKYGGTRGNALSIVIKKNVDEDSKFDVSVYLDTALVFQQKAVSTYEELAQNDWVEWQDTPLAETASTPLTGGTNGTVNGDAHSAYLGVIEPYAVNAIGAATTDPTTKALYAAFAKRMRDEVGAKMQVVLHQYAQANHEGVISVENNRTAELVYWATGAIGGCGIGKSLLNERYTGEFEVDTNYKQSQLEEFMQSGRFAFHNVDGVPCVLADSNTFVSGSPEKSVEIFGNNQSVRVMDAIANDVATVFKTKYLGKIQNNADGRVSLWNDIVSLHRQLETMQAIEGFQEDDVKVLPGEKKNSVVVNDAVTIVNAMAKLYMTVTIA